MGKWPKTSLFSLIVSHRWGLGHILIMAHLLPKWVGTCSLGIKPGCYPYHQACRHSHNSKHRPPNPPNHSQGYVREIGSLVHSHSSPMVSTAHREKELTGALPSKEDPSLRILPLFPRNHQGLQRNLSFFSFSFFLLIYFLHILKMKAFLLVSLFLPRLHKTFLWQLTPFVPLIPSPPPLSLAHLCLSWLSLSLH